MKDPQDERTKRVYVWLDVSGLDVPEDADDEEIAQLVRDAVADGEMVEWSYTRPQRRKL